MRLIINGYDIELIPDEKIARTLQVNDILSINNRQTNYTNTFSIKRTDKNKKAFDYLGVVSVLSYVPYRLNEVYLYSDDGECIVYKGRAVVQSTDKDYKINIYDGNIDLYKAIENKSLGDLDLSQIDHNKILSTVVNSFTANLNYKYIVADYNGKMVYNSNRINIDYLVPSAKVSYLWNKIFTEYGFTYSGSIFNTVDFTNLWLTYPKFQETTQIVTEIFNVTTAVSSTPVFPTFIVPETGTYQIGGNNISGSITVSLFTYGGTLIETITITPSLFINGVSVTNNATFNLNIGDVVTLDFVYPNLNNADVITAVDNAPFQTQLIVSQYQGVPISFTNELKDFSIRDFITEILNRFGLTPFKDKYSDHYKFLTLQELLQDNQTIDWSREKNKFVEKISERYIFGSYAQENNFTYKYNDAESDYYNSDILINNVNLPDSKTVVNSRFFAPEKDRTVLIHDLQSNVYKMWNKEVKDDGTITYKPLQKRYFLMREASHTFTTNTQIGSESLGTHQTITTIPVETFYNLRMQDIIRNYYGAIGSILNYSKIVDATIYLSENDISNMDFSKLYWIKELSSYFLLNKVLNFVKKGIIRVELIKVDYTASNNKFGFSLIEELKGIKPKLHFGYNQRNATVVGSNDVVIYQDTIYNATIYDVPTVNTGKVISSSLNKIVLSFAGSGIYTVNVTVASKDGLRQLVSNNLIITVI